MYVNGTDWVLSEKLYCMSCGHQGLWLGCDDVFGLEHFCTSCGWDMNVILNIRPDIDIHRKVLQQRETELNGNQAI